MNYDNYVFLDELEKHETYLRLLGILERRADVIEYVPRDGYDPNDAFYKIGKRFVINEYHTTEWAGIASGSGLLCSLRADGSVFKLLRTYESFFGRDKRKKYPDRWNDWAFYDKNGVLLFYTVPHEYEAVILNELIKELNNDNQKRKNQNHDGRRY